MARTGGYVKQRLVAAFVIAFMLGGLSYAEITNDAAAEAERLRANGDHAAAVKVLADAIKADPLDQHLADMLRDSQRILSEEDARLKKEKALREAEALRIEAKASYEKGDLDAAIRAWSQVLVLDPQDDSSAWMIQKAQTRKQLEPPALKSGASQRDYNKKIKTIADDITKLISQAKEKLRQDGEERKRRELAALEEDAANEKRLQLEEEKQAQESEEAFIAGTFKQGQELYAKGKYDEALCAWQAILPLLTQDSELKAKISALCEIKTERAPDVPDAGRLAEAAKPVISSATEPIDEPAKTTPVAVEPAPESPKTAPSAVEPPSGPVIAPPEKAEPAVVPIPAPIAGPPVIDKKITPPTPAVSSRNFARIIIVIVAVTLIFIAAIWTVFYTTKRFVHPRRQPPVGKGFDPSKLALFLKKSKQDGQQDKDIFKVR